MKKAIVENEGSRDLEYVERELAAYEELRQDIEHEIYMIPRDIIVKMIAVIVCLIIVIIWLVVYS